MASIDRMSLLELFRNYGIEGNVDFLKEVLQVLVQSLMEAEVTAQLVLIVTNVVANVQHNETDIGTVNGILV